MKSDCRKSSAPCFVLYFNQQYDLKINMCCFLFSRCPLDGKWAVGSDCGKLRDSIRKREQGSARPALQSCFSYTLICCRGHGEVGTRTTLLRPKTGQACSASRLPLGGFLTQNKTRQKLCFPGPRKSCSHLVLLRGRAINHPLPDSLLCPPRCRPGAKMQPSDGRSIATKLQQKERFPRNGGITILL